MQSAEGGAGAARSARLHPGGGQLGLGARLRAARPRGGRAVAVQLGGRLQRLARRRERRAEQAWRTARLMISG